jgi:ATP-dependent helicase/nuclease subunit A
LRDQAAVLTPREAVELVIARCGLARRVVQWQQGADRARVRLANLDRVIGLAQQYEDECLSGRDAASLSGLLLWLQDLQANELDTKALPAVDAVQVMTHHAAKGLEWPVVVLCDLASDVRDRLWGVQTESLSAFDVDRPLHRRFVRYWPWAFGAQKKVAIADEIASLPVGQAAHADAAEENKRLLYVSMTRARDLLVFARQAKKQTGEWMDSVALGESLAQGGPTHHQAAQRH